MKINLPLSIENKRNLKLGDTVYLNGEILTARDCAHKKICNALKNGEKLPFDLRGQIIYYAGPCPAPLGLASGSCGPTTSARMNTFAPMLLDYGLCGMIGKGEMNKEVCESIKKNNGIYFSAIGGAGAIYGSAILKSEIIAYPELLSEAVYKLTVKDFPVIVAIDSFGNTIYKI